MEHPAPSSTRPVSGAGTAWRELGACRGLDSELFFPTRDTPSAPAIARCGTANGYQAHIRAGETACEACRDARNVYQAQRKHLKASA